MHETAEEKGVGDPLPGTNGAVLQKNYIGQNQKRKVQNCSLEDLLDYVYQKEHNPLLKSRAVGHINLGRDPGPLMQDLRETLAVAMKETVKSMTIVRETARTAMKVAPVTGRVRIVTVFTAVTGTARIVRTVAVIIALVGAPDEVIRVIVEVAIIRNTGKRRTAALGMRIRMNHRLKSHAWKKRTPRTKCQMTWRK